MDPSAARRSRPPSWSEVVLDAIAALPRGEGVPPALPPGAAVAERIRGAAVASARCMTCGVVVLEPDFEKHRHDG